MLEVERVECRESGDGGGGMQECRVSAVERVECREKGDGGGGVQECRVSAFSVQLSEWLWWGS